jgi:YgiT-type zinc finger domain-containing protein
MAMRSRHIPKCDCGGSLLPTTFHEYDFSAYAGLRIVLEAIPGLRCDHCGGETLDGKLINSVTTLLVFGIVKSPNRLDGEQARYLRRYLGQTQKELAVVMGLVRETVADWERGDGNISPQNDYVLRGITMSLMLKAGHIDGKEMDKIMTAALGAVRTGLPGNEIQISSKDLESFQSAARAVL